MVIHQRKKNMFLNTNDQMLRKEAEWFSTHRATAPEQAITDNAVANAESNQAANGEEQDFQDFHRRREMTRVEDRFLASHRDFVNTPQNHLAVVRWLSERNLTEIDVAEQPGLLEQAYVDLRSQHALQLDETKRTFTSNAALKDRIDEIRLEASSADQIFNEFTALSEQQQLDEAADRKVFEASAARPALRFIRVHPEYVVNLANKSKMDAWLTGHGINLERVTFEHFEAAFRELSANGQLQLDRSQIRQQSTEDDFDPETCSMTELERRCGGRETNGRPAPKDDYVPTPGRGGLPFFS
jgi:hypothetical protein